VISAIVPFLLPTGESGDRNRPLLTWREAREIPGDVLIFFAGGLSLAATMESSRLTAWIGESMGRCRCCRCLVLVGVDVVTVVVSEMASNAGIDSWAMSTLRTCSFMLSSIPLQGYSVCAAGGPCREFAEGQLRVRLREGGAVGLHVDCG